MIAQTFKKCKKCGIKYPITDFYKHPRMLGGYINFCKFCKRRYANKRTKSFSVEDWQKHTELNRKWRKYHRKEYKSRNKLNNAIRNGNLTKPEFCEKCGKGCKLHGHHPSYDYPLKVIWLCPLCHAKEHELL